MNLISQRYPLTFLRIPIRTLILKEISIALAAGTNIQPTVNILIDVRWDIQTALIHTYKHKKFETA